MDTRYWGPGAWRLLHLIAESQYALKAKPMWKMLPYVLPCKFCRASLTDYYDQLPIPSKQEEFSEWLYKIHNMVNKKLRDQGQNIPPDPPYSAVKERYKTMLEQGCTKTEFPGWEFFFCIADNHPDSSPSKPMPDAPSTVPTSYKEKNRYNLLTPEERKVFLAKFWKSIPQALPFKEWQGWWTQCSHFSTKSRRDALQWLWKVRCCVREHLQTMSTITFHGLCKQVATHRSGCSKSTRARTCRKIKSQRKTRRNKQR